MNYILFDGEVRNALLPFTFTRPVADIRVGILTIREKWEKYLGYTTTTVTEEYLEAKFPMVETEQNIMINSAFLPNEQLVELIQELKPNQAIGYQEDIVAFFTEEEQEDIDFDEYEILDFSGSLIKIEHTWDIFQYNDAAIRQDYALLTEDRISEPIPATVQVLGREQVFIEEGAVLNFVTLNATTGPIYIGKNTEIMEGAIIRGPFALCEGAQVKMGAKIYGATTIGPECRVGGEVSNSVMFGYSNKGHDGFLGNSVLGEWCNLGADTNNSNLKNNYAPVKLWSYETQAVENTGLQFCGLMMGDHSKSGINTMFNTGTVVGVACSIFGGGFPKTFLPSFTWGGKDLDDVYDVDKAIKTMQIVMSRRHIEWTAVEEKIIRHLAEENKLERFQAKLSR
ncbi:GlmU family protein [Myroides odoratus]|jgi:UDP-N-acetylglucosamine diphosphorylase/glucosamine-1-phosphate N-acetyltransferase|uniref:GlmU family protein n=1 Tax=Myroides odoratus TaxID=256 RepID=A0A9Q6Z7E4_MYROD|nr:GlmU family protein [Myroides odoratus]EHQ41721.1 transferase hexapeptide repeat containing protein [Myroides odoratus DSM 2801]EKB08898.1 UDP-N-acetylglucosamine diphosphorylase/glucosamine-1-phosphate N-acetyltransferase [Myroides odoratus CIP 103059]QQT99127.1 GlmU family protein [Myroides odoratus]WQD58680.1 GlmU family protein [Myroides odoratus]STZ28980.1 UDP-N-acetylglucosamine diphosphorylase/glucosamine-1-phosphate N-acetyltransferase [Myroides odoratus]